MLKNKLEKLFGRNHWVAVINYNKELVWAHIYHDSIRDKNWMKDLAINVGRSAANYPFFYVLNRVLSDYRPREILEFGLGESSKVVSTYLDNYLTGSSHTIIEHDAEWKNNFDNRFTLSPRSTVSILPLVVKNVKRFEYKGYENIEQFITKKYDLYLVDGPFGSPSYSRYDIISVMEKMNRDDEFILIFDDYNRVGEKRTFKVLEKILKEKEIDIFTGFYKGVKTVAVIGTKKYRFVKSL